MAGSGWLGGVALMDEGPAPTDTPESGPPYSRKYLYSNPDNV